MRFGTRTFLLAAVPNIALLAAAFYFVEKFTVSALTDNAKRELRETQAAMVQARARSQAESARLTAIVAENAPLKAGMQLMALEHENADARLTVEDQLREIGVQLDLGYLSVSYSDGSFMAGMIRGSNGWVPLQPGRLSAPSNGFAWSGRDIYAVTTNRVSQGREELGELSIGRAYSLNELGMPAVLMYGGKVLLSNIPGIPDAELERGLRGCQGVWDCQLRLANANYLSARLDGPRSRQGCALISLESLDQAAGPAAARLHRTFLILGLSAVGFALIGSLLSARAIVQPLAAIIGRLRASEQSGELAGFSPSPLAVREVRELAESFNRAAAANRKSQEDLRRAYLEFTGSLASALDARDTYTAGHSQRVSEYACAIATGLGLTVQEIAEIRIGALLHDIGKIGINDSVLQKPGRLTHEEAAAIRQHPTIGRRILEGVNGFQPYLPVVELHHENWDGSGYPHGLRGEQVPLAARIVHVADAFDAMTSDRPYRRGTPAAEAFAILRRFTGSQFDPAIVTAFIGLGLGASGLPSLIEHVDAAQAASVSVPELKSV
jgi:HD-GYP domain-containing protein (c-di-GMP phosphodiesterase class II)